ncbi:unnamed protein product [Caenorhabditis angaria]|uniref:Phosphoinositide phospholipase C n=1 Tax=Caenorhabditis angaria TaxID=860376 RepID=A0A9P1IQ86_9PELO|nr:unnamed protein product [Caenorhabditis angaria]
MVCFFAEMAAKSASSEQLAAAQAADEEKARVEIEWAEKGSLMSRVKRGKIKNLGLVSIQNKKFLNYYSSYWFNFIPNALKSVSLAELLEVRVGYQTDNLQKASKRYEFQEVAPDHRCFSVIFSHAKFLHKSVDFVADSKETRDKWVSVLTHLISVAKHQRVVFNETAWLIDKFQQADTNKNGLLTFDEVWNLLKRMNLQISERYAKAIFRESELENSRDNKLNEKEFLNFFERLTDRPDLRFVMQQASSDNVETLTVADLQRFLTEEQGFTNIDLKKAESILDTFEQTVQDKQKEKLMGLMGMRRLMQSRWGNVFKSDHTTIFQDMNQSLSHYFVNSSHNTYLTGLQVKGEATVEGYISALRKGARLLELDLFDGEHGEPVITHKRTFIESITLRNSLEAIKRTAFETSPYPVILTLENHVGHAQQIVMAELFDEILGNMLYRPPKDSSKNPLPSPNDLKRKFLLRGKKILTSDEVDDNDDDDSPTEKDKHNHHPHPIAPELSNLIALPSVKLTSNIYHDVNTHPLDGSPSLSENKVYTLFEAATPVFHYSAERLVKSYPKGLRQDSSNMHPIVSWLCGIQSVAMNFQTAGEELDLNAGMFRVNGNCGYVLKPKILLDGIDPRTMIRPKMKLGIGLFSAQYLPKSEPGKEIIDPYVSVQIFGIPRDETKAKTRIIKDNGFNPEWRDNFYFTLCCPELAIIRFCVKDFDSTSSNDFVGEFSIPVMSLRTGYSQIQLNTGYQHTLDPSASLFVRIAIDDL